MVLSGSRRAGDHIRFGHMGVTASSVFPVVGLMTLGRALDDLGERVPAGDGVDAAMAVLAGE